MCEQTESLRRSLQLYKIRKALENINRNLELIINEGLPIVFPEGGRENYLNARTKEILEENGVKNIE